MTSERRTSSLRCPARVAGRSPLEIHSLIVAALTRISLAISIGVSQGSSQLPPMHPDLASYSAVSARLMTAGQVAELLAVPKTRVWSMSRRGEIPTVRIGPREVRYRPEDIEAWIARRTTPRPRGTQS